MAMILRLLRRLGVNLTVAALGFFVGVLSIYIWWVQNGPPLEPWHTEVLAKEFTADRAAEVPDLPAYRAVEARLLEEMDERIYAKTPTGAEHALVRYSKGSAADPRIRTPNWNLTFELGPADPIGGVLLLHGMSDGPYSLRALGESLAAAGYRVLGLRMPGHGMVPAGLLEVTWEDMAAATRLGMDHLAQGLGGRPIHVFGYSTGAALALDYALNARAGAGAGGQVPASLVLVSPAVGITPLAAIVPWVERLGRLPGLDALAWTNRFPEFDPFNYNSFSANASMQVHRMTRSVAERVRRLAAEGPIADFPRTLVLVSAVDATVSPAATVDLLLRHLAPERHALLLYDINRFALKAPLIVADPAPLTNRLMADASLPFDLTLVTNAAPDSRQVVAITKAVGAGGETAREPLADGWPDEAISLSHVDLPFPPDDPLYGRYPPVDRGQVFLGQLAIRGERGVLKLPGHWLLRLRYNPFYDYQERRVLDWVAAANAEQSGAAVTP